MQFGRAQEKSGTQLVLFRLGKLGPQ